MPGQIEQQHLTQPKLQAHRGDRLALPLRTWLILLFVLVAFVPLCVLAIVAYSQVSNQMRNAAYQALLHSARYTAEDITRGLDHHLHSLSEWNIRHDLDAIYRTNPGSNPAVISAELNDALEYYQPYIQDLGVVNSTGEVSICTTNLHEAGIQVEQGKLTELLAQHQSAAWLDSEANGQPILLLFAPFLESEQQGGMIAAFDPQLLHDSMHLSQELLRTRSIGVAWNDEQQLLAGTQNSFRTGTDIVDIWPGIQQGKIPAQGQPTIVEIRFQDQLKPAILATATIPEWDWIVMYAQPVSSIMLPGILNPKYTLVCVLLNLLLLIILAISITRMVAIPVQRITTALSQASSGESICSVPPTNISELSSLISSYYELSTKLVNHEAEADERNHILYDRFDYLQRFITATNRLRGYVSLNQLYPAFLEEAALQLGVEGGSLYLIAGSQLNLIHTLDPGHAPPVIAFPPNQVSPLGIALERGEPVLLDRLAASPYMLSGWDGYQQDAALLFVLHDKNNQPIALVSLHNKTDGHFTSQDLEICRFLSSFGSERFRLSKANEDLAASESRFRRLVETAQEGIITVDDQEAITFANNSIARALGFRPSELTGIPLTSLVKPEYHEKLFGGTLQRRRGISSIYEVELIAKDGRIRNMQVAASPLLDQQGAYEGALGVLTDITDLKRSHHDLADQSAYLHSVFTALSDMICVVSKDLRVTNANARFRREFGLPSLGQLEVEYSSLFDGLLSPSNQLTPAAIVQDTFASGENQTGEFLLLAPDGERILEVDAAPLRDSTGETIGVVEVLRDVSGQRRLEGQLRHAHKMEAVGRLASGIAHDFNNLLTAITGCAEVAIGEISEDSVAASELKEICQATQRGREVVRQILALSRRQEQDRRPVSLRTVVSEVLSLMRASLPPAIEIHQEFNAQRDSVLADAGQLHQVVMNLCTNAVQAMAATGGELSAVISLENVGVDQLARHPHLRPGEHVRLDVSDTGHGIDAELFERIFEPFFTTKGGQGTGLGLSVAKSNVLSHGGAVEVSSEPGSGSCFSILLPLTDLQAIPVEPVPMTSQGKERVLFVDDEQLIVRTTERLLSRLGYEVTALADSREALRLFQQKPDDFDILITDQTMPVFTGIELATAVLKLRPSLPVVLCTGYSESVPPERARQLGISEYVMKPYSGEELGVVIRRLLDRDS